MEFKCEQILKKYEKQRINCFGKKEINNEINKNETQSIENEFFFLYLHQFVINHLLFYGF